MTPTPADIAPFQRIFILILENKSLSQVLADAYFTALARRGTLLTHYYGIAHPSEPNYLALLAGDPLVAGDGSYNLPQTNLVDMLEPAGVSWKAYLENYPGACFAGVSMGALYARKHNPFISFDDVRTNPQRCANLVNADQLPVDLTAGHLPRLSFYVPNLKDDAHDTSVAYSARWLQGFLDPLLADPRFTTGTLVVITFDETDDFRGGPAAKPLYTVLLGPMVRAGAVDARPYTHYSLLRTVEEAFGLGTLHRHDTTATPLAACDFTGGCGP
jgi:phospholipase C